MMKKSYLILLLIILEFRGEKSIEKGWLERGKIWSRRYYRIGNSCILDERWWKFATKNWIEKNKRSFVTFVEFFYSVEWETIALFGRMKLRNLCFLSAFTQHSVTVRRCFLNFKKRLKAAFARIAFVLSATLAYRETAAFLDDETLSRLYDIKNRFSAR